MSKKIDCPNISSHVNSGLKTNSFKRKRNSTYFENNRKQQKLISETKFSSPYNDIDERPYANVVISGYDYIGLLDSGANISAFGFGCQEFLDNTGAKIYAVKKESVSTASGSKQKIIGFVKVKITFHNQTKLFRLYLIPSLQQKLYLGIDFWKAFGIEPIQIPNISAIQTDESINVSVSDSQIPLSTEQRVKLNFVISQMPSSKKLGLGKTSLLQHTIKLLDGATPHKERYYPISPAVQKEVYAELDRMLELGVIEKSRSAWSSPMAVVRKANGSVRLCLDARKLNKVTVKDAYPIPIIDGLLSRLEQTKFITCLDLKDAFWQIPLDPESRDKTAFTVYGTIISIYSYVFRAVQCTSKSMCFN